MHSYCCDALLEDAGLAIPTYKILFSIEAVRVKTQPCPSIIDDFFFKFILPSRNATMFMFHSGNIIQLFPIVQRLLYCMYSVINILNFSNIDLSSVTWRTNTISLKYSYNWKLVTHIFLIK